MLLCALPLAAGILEDNFDDGDMGGWKFERGLEEQWKIKDGELILGSNMSLTGFSIGEYGWRDYTVGARVKITKHQPVLGLSEMATIIVRAKDPANFYVFGIGTLGLSNRQAQGYHFEAGKTGGFKKVPFAWKLDTWYDLKVEVKGNQYKLYVHGELMFEYISELFQAGKVGLGVGNSVTAHFDNFFATGDDVTGNPQAVPPPAILATTWGKLKMLEQ
jgi:hypothetical protein